MLPMTLTKYESVAMQPARRTELLEELARTLEDRNRLKRHNDDIAKKAKEILKARESRITELTDQLTLGTESVGRDCTVEYNLLTNTTVLKDAKTHELIEERAMTAIERQEFADSRDDQPSFGNGSRRKHS